MEAEIARAAAAGSRARARAVASARAYGALTLATLRSSAQRPATVVLRGIGSALVALCEAVGMVLMVNRFGSIAGWRTPEIIVLAGLVFTGQGLAQAVGNRLRPEDVSLMIRRGTFDQVLTRPISPLGFVITGYVEIRLLGRFVAGAGMLAWAGRAAGIAWTLTTWRLRRWRSPVAPWSCSRCWCWARRSPSTRCRAARR